MKTATRLVNEIRFSVTTYGLAKLLQIQALRHPTFREQLRQEDLALQLRLRDGSRGRLVVFKRRAGLHQAGHSPRSRTW